MTLLYFATGCRERMTHGAIFYSIIQNMVSIGLLGIPEREVAEIPPITDERGPGSGQLEAQLAKSFGRFDPATATEWMKNCR